MAIPGAVDQVATTPEPKGKRPRAALADITNTPPQKRAASQSPPCSAKVAVRRVRAAISGSTDGLLTSTLPCLAGTVSCSPERCGCTRPHRPLGAKAADALERKESQKLVDMNEHFVADCRAARSIVVSRACVRDSDVYFFIEGSGEPTSDIVGYATISRGFEHGIEPNLPGLDAVMIERTLKVHPRLPLLTQLYVDAERRRAGVATAGLRTLLAGHEALVVDAPSRATLLVLERVGLKFVGAKPRPEGHTFCLFVRAVEIDENAP
eukprot:gnl/TRDRNA2_/TRDRNA2_40300_c0_seq1.p1 gnl/TRDRNA2_/TRDRNA2_40300_c0~~gnl/TRDRNA2_/TRDRNA2_40300_c0_seq1.p1  ORF type:complete len:266 (+),score=35.18 gnl/TRDRNA2_/TRDRNA2_40300_c0_seq1:75-872(+)